MSTQNNPTVSCLLDDGSGTYPIDISSQVSLSAGIDITGYGRADESTSASAAQLTLTVKNNDGSFTTGTGFGSGGFGSGYYGGVVGISKGQRIKFGLTLGATYRDCFVGRIDSLGQSFTGAPGLRSDITITALDAFSDYGKRPLRSMLEQEILLDSPSAYYTLGEATGATTAGDTSGNGATPLAIAGTGTPVVFGQGTGPVDGLPTVQFAGGQYLSATTPAYGSGSWSVAVFFSTTTLPAAGLVTPIVSANDAIANLPVFAVLLDEVGEISVRVKSVNVATGATPNLADGAVHSVVATYDSPGNVVRIYVDGTLASLPSGTALTAVSAGDLTVGWTLNRTFSFAGYSHFTGFVSHVAIFDGAVLSSSRAAAYGAALTGFAETSDARISRLATYAGTTAVTTTGSSQTMGSQDTTGAALLDAFGTVADTEGGFLYIDGSGQLRMQGRYYRAQEVTATLSVSGKAVDPGSFTIVDDTQQALNQMTVTRIGGATQTWPLLTPSTNVYPGSLDLAVDTDANALYRAQWEVAKHSTPGPRLPSATTSNLRTSGSAANLFARDLGDRLHFTALPATTNPALGDVTIEGWSMHLDRDTWTYTYNLLPWSLAQVFILDDTTYGVLDSSTPIGY